jgi:tetratricopeptide (TPR) repeat protein
MKITGIAAFAIAVGVMAWFGFGKSREPDDVTQLEAAFRDLKLKPDFIARVVEPIANAPDTEAPWVGAAAELRRQGYPRASERTYDIALRRFPNSFRLWGNRGVLLRQNGQTEEAIEAFQKALAIKSDYSIAANNLANTYELAQDFPRAIEWYRKALAFNASDKFSWNGWGNCEAAQGRFEQAFECYERAISLDPNYSEPRWNKIMQLIRQGRPREAIQELDAYLARWPEDDQARVALAKLKDQTLDGSEIHNAQLPEQVKLVVRGFDNIDHESAPGRALSVPPSSQKVVSFGELAEMSREEAKARGLLAAYDKAQLQKLVKQRLATTPPPEDTRIFLSYRRENAEHMAWMRRIAQELDDRGYDVLLDQFIRGLETAPSVPELISLMVSCNVFSPVLTDGYFERIDPGDGPIVSHLYMSDGWVFDEYQLAMHLGEMRRLVVTGIWRSGQLQPPFNADNVLDLRNDKQFSRALDAAFPRRKLMVVAMRAAGRGRTIGPFSNSRAQKTVKEFVESGEYSQVRIIDAAAL